MVLYDTVHVSSDITLAGCGGGGAAGAGTWCFDASAMDSVEYCSCFTSGVPGKRRFSKFEIQLIAWWLFTNGDKFLLC